METTTGIPVIQKSKITKKEKAEPAVSCCTPKDNADVCCTPSLSKTENNGACCDQPSDGSACCNK
jgi:hypothetical protein